MSIIKVLLLAAIAVVGFAAFRGGHSALHRAVWRLAGLVLILAAGLSVVFPNSLTAIAQAVGVNRGADLLLYVLVVVFMLVAVILFRRVGELEQRYVDLVRRIAVDEASREASREEAREEARTRAPADDEDGVE